MQVVAHKNAAGDVAIGVEEDGLFVPFVTFNAAKFAQFVQRAENLQARAEAGDGLALDVLGSAFQKPKTKKKGEAAEEEVS